MLSTSLKKLSMPGLHYNGFQPFRDFISLPFSTEGTQCLNQKLMVCFIDISKCYTLILNKWDHKHGEFLQCQKHFYSTKIYLPSWLGL